MALSPGMQLSHYVIVSPLGAGGMGEVYRARDSRLRRTVALKILPDRFTRSPDRLRRFEQEALAASALNHPNIVTIYEIGEAEGVRFIAMEFVEGVTLREHARHSPPALERVLDIAVQMASAVAAAHKARIVHRDIKPENVMVRRDGQVKVLDFGLAKLTAADEGPDAPPLEEAPTRPLQRTEPGKVFGTTSYMSPEQARGLETDGRTDIWSLGVVLYELTAGRAPFAGQTSSDVIASVLKTEPAPLSRFRAGVPAELDRIAAKALRKDRDERYQTCQDLLLDLKSLKEELEFAAGLERRGGEGPPRAEAPDTAAPSPHTTTPSGGAATDADRGAPRLRRRAIFAVVALLAAAAVAAYFLLGARRDARPADGIDSIAVLPFDNTGGDPKADYLADGLTESVINSLTRISRLRVIPRGSVFRFKGKAGDVREIARQLGVRAVLTGRVAQRGDDLDIQTELVDATADAQLWGEKYNRKLSDVFVVQEEIAREIAEKLRLRLTGEEQKRVSKRYTDDLEAYRLYLLGRHNSEQRTEQGLRQAIQYFNQAVAKDPNYALAYAGLADSYGPLAYYGHAYPKDTQPLSQAAARKAVELDDSLVEAHATLAACLFFQRKDWAGAEKEYLRAIELNPNYSDPHSFRAAVMVATGRTGEETVAEARRGLALDPLSPLKNTLMAQVLFFSRRFDEAVAQGRSAINTNPNAFQLHSELSLALVQKGMYQEALAEQNRALELSGNSPYMTAVMAYVYAASGDRSAAVRLLNGVKEQARHRYVSSYHIALVHAALGEKEQALDWLDQAFEERNEPMVYVGVDPRLDGLRSEPRFKNLLRSMNLPS